MLQEDIDFTKRVEHLFSAKVERIDSELVNQLPPLEHLLNWALELQEENLVLLSSKTVPQSSVL